jgi:hypothetical protein
MRPCTTCGKEIPDEAETCPLCGDVVPPLTAPGQVKGCLVGIGRVYRSITEPVRTELPWDERWKGSDRGLIHNWELGRQWREAKPELAARAERGELPVLGWKGGVEKALKKTTKKYGVHHYIAMWQGLRGEDLDVDPSIESRMVCTRTGVVITYTNDIEKYGKEEKA